MDLPTGVGSQAAALRPRAPGAGAPVAPAPPEGQLRDAAALARRIGLTYRPGSAAAAVAAAGAPDNPAAATSGGKPQPCAPARRPASARSASSAPAAGQLQQGGSVRQQHHQQPQLTQRQQPKERPKHAQPRPAAAAAGATGPSFVARWTLEPGAAEAGAAASSGDEELLTTAEAEARQFPNFHSWMQRHGQRDAGCGHAAIGSATGRSRPTSSSAPREHAARCFGTGANVAEAGGGQQPRPHSGVSAHVSRPCSAASGPTTEGAGSSGQQHARRPRSPLAAPSPAAAAAVAGSWQGLAGAGAAAAGAATAPSAAGAHPRVPRRSMSAADASRPAAPERPTGGWLGHCAGSSSMREQGFPVRAPPAAGAGSGRLCGSGLGRPSGSGADAAAAALAEAAGAGADTAAAEAARATALAWPASREALALDRVLSPPTWDREAPMGLWARLPLRGREPVAREGLEAMEAALDAALQEAGAPLPPLELPRVIMAALELRRRDQEQQQHEEEEEWQEGDGQERGEQQQRQQRQQQQMHRQLQEEEQQWGRGHNAGEERAADFDPELPPWSAADQVCIWARTCPQRALFSSSVH